MSYNSWLIMPLLAMSLGLRFYASRKGGTGGGGRVSTLDPLLLGLAVESAWSALGGPFLSSFARMGFENGLLAM